MKLNFIGYGGAFDSITNSSAYWIKNEYLNIIDVGENTFSKYKELLTRNKFKGIRIYITHTHSDHVGGLSTLLHYLYYVDNTPYKICVPTPIYKTLKQLLSLMGNNYDTNLIPCIIHNNVRYIKTNHVDDLDCYGVLISENTYYSGDSNNIPREMIEKLKNNEIEDYYQDISLTDYDGNVHMSERVFKDLVGDFIDKINTNIYFYHNTKYNPEIKIDKKKFKK